MDNDIVMMNMLYKERFPKVSSIISFVGVSKTENLMLPHLDHMQ